MGLWGFGPSLKHVTRGVLKYLPSKNFILIVLVTALVAAGIVWARFLPEKSVSIAKKNPAANTEAGRVRESLDKDSDGDGLKDWEEVLWKTDPKNPDTDGDGTNDNDEILAKRDPLRAGPDDALPNIAALETSAAKNITGPVSEENITAGLAKEFGTIYFRQKFSAQGDAIDPQQFSAALYEEITQALVGKASQLPEGYFSVADFTALDTNAPGDMRAYINKLGSVLESVTFSGRNEIEIASEALMREEFDGIGELVVYSNNYRALAERMKTVPVPRELMDAHIAMANNFWRLSIIVADMSRLREDPIRGTIGMREYAEEAERGGEPLRRIVEEIKSRNFVFGESEGGSAFNRYVNAS